MAFSLKQLSLLVSFLSVLPTISAVPGKTPGKGSDCDYDIIVVGAGAGGLVAATKFAEAGMNTLLLERGGPMLYRDGNREIPEWSLEEYPGNNITRHDAMGYYLVNYPGRSPEGASYYCSGLPTGGLAACMLGGGTSVNAEQQFWPPRNYLNDAFGFKGWTADDFQPAIERVASRIVPTTYWSADQKHYYDEVYPLMSSVLQTIGMKEVNTTANGDDKYNTFGRDVFASKGGLRSGPLVGYLQDAKKLPNFTLKMYSTVSHFVHTKGTITGVYVNGTTITAKNFVLSAGVWNTPALLFASGIGSSSDLATAAKTKYTTYTKKDWVINSAVGGNLHDNPTTSIALTYNDTAALPFFSSSGLLTGVNITKTDTDLFFNHFSGPLTEVGRELVGWITIPADTQASIPSMTIQTICSAPSVTNGSFSCQFKLNEGLLSRGRITLSPTGNLTYAAGTGPWLTDARDVKPYALAMQKFIAGANAYPGLNVTAPPAGSLASYETFLSSNANVSNNHWGGSCTVGPSDGTKSGGTDCVDLNAKVYGTANLFVVDGSLSPKPTTSNPSFLYETIAELASERIMKLVGV